MWNARVPERYPAVIVQARDVYDVVAAVKRARREGLRIGVRAGGHSWAGNHVRQGGLLLDVSRLREATIDAGAMRATVGPGCPGHQLAGQLRSRGLFFPAGHCRGVCVGGYLLQGGFGWNGRALGPACMSVVGLDLVTADGEIVHASETENPDLFFAARGAGPGFFAVVTRFHLKVYPRPAVSGMVLHSYPMECMEEVLRFAHAAIPHVPDSVELQFILSRNAVGVGGPGIELCAPVFAPGYRAALRDLDFLSSGPLGGAALRKRAAVRLPFLPLPLSLLYRMVMHHYPARHRYAVDNMWTHAPVDALLPGIRRIVETLPPPPSHVLWLNWAPRQRRPDMAFSMEDDIYLALYGAWKDPRDDARYERWATERMAEMAGLASGCQLADENLGQRLARFVSEENLRRLDEIRAKWDPQGTFYSWMGRP